MAGRWNVLLGHGLFSAAFISVSGRVYHVYPTGKRWYPLHLAIFFPEEYGFLHPTANGGTPFWCRTHTIGFPRAWKFSWSMGSGFPSSDAGLQTCDFSKMVSQKAAKRHMMWFCILESVEYSLDLWLTTLCWWFLKAKSYWFLGQKKTSLPLSGHIRVVNVISHFVIVFHKYRKDTTFGCFTAGACTVSPAACLV